MKINASVFLDLGISEAESNVYTALLMRGQSGASDLLPHLNLSRPNLYYNLDLLKQKGLILEIPGKKRHFKAAPPNKLIQLAQNKVSQAEETRNRVSDALPELNELFTLSTERPALWQHDGIEGIQQINKAIIAEAEELFIFHSKFHRESPELVEELDKQIIRQRKKGIKIRALFHESFGKLSREYIADLRKHNTDVRIFYDTDFILPAEILIWNDTVAITTLKNEISVTIIKNDDFATTLKKIFETLWKFGKADVREAYQ